MNYLAHIFLSGDDPQLQIGNFAGDAVKGSAYRKYPPAIAEGILLHRAIDDFTDKHPLVREAIGKLRPYFGRYSAVLLDIYFDYLLASRFELFSEVPLRRFARRFYINLIRYRRRLPARIRRFMWHFIASDRLVGYSRMDGVRRSLEIMTSVRDMHISVDIAIGFLFDRETELLGIFMQFFPELQSFCAGYLHSVVVGPADE